MKLLSRYVIISMLISYVICIGIALSFYVIIDMFSKFYRFSDYVALAEKNHQQISLWWILFQYYFYHTPIIIYHLLPIITLMAAMFTVTGMARANELTPLKACGIPIYWLFKPILIVTLCAVFFMFALQEWVIPRFASKIEEVKRMETTSAKIMPEILFCDSEKRVISIGRYYPLSMRLQYVRVFEPATDIEKNTLLIPSRVLEAESGEWETNAAGKRMLILREGKEDIYNKQGMLLSSTFFGKKGISIQTNMRHKHLANPGDKNLEITSTTNLKRILKERPQFAMAKVMYHNRFSFPLSSIILVLLGLPWLLRHHTRNLFVGSAICVMASSIFYGFHLICINLGYKEVINATFAAWFPTITFFSLGLGFCTVIHS